MKKLTPRPPRPERETPTSIMLGADLRKRVDAEVEHLNMTRTDFIKEVLVMYLDEFGEAS